MLSQKEVEHITKLARIKLSEDEKEKYEKELSGILDFVEQLNEVDTSQVEPMTGGTDFKNVYRPDEQVSQDLENKQTEMIEAAPEQKDGYIKVKSVFI